MTPPRSTRQARTDAAALTIGNAGGNATEHDTPHATDDGRADMSEAELAEIELEEALSEIPSQARASLNWYDAKSGQWVYLCQLSPDQVRREFVRENFGGGRFKGRFRNGASWGRTFEFNIDPAIPRRVPAWLMGDVTPSAATTAPASAKPAPIAGDVSMDKLLMSEMMDLMRTGRDLRSAQADSSTAMMAAVMGMVKSMTESTAALVTSIAGAKNGRQEIGIADILKLLEHRQPTAEITAALEKLKGRSGGDDLGAIEKALALIDRLRGKARRNGDDGGEGGEDDDDADPLVSIARELLPPIVKALTGESMGGPRTAPAATARARVAGEAAPANVPANAAPPSEPAAPAAPMPPAPPSFLDVVYTSVLEGAQEGEDPREFAVSLLQMVPRIFRGRVREFVIQPDAAAQVCAQYPDLAQYGTWVTECIAGLREEFNPPPDDEPAAPPAGG